MLNLQGDVVALITADCTIVAQYTYNAWGKLLSVTDEDGEAITSASHIANLNPIRYRGYYYDTETGFYYLQSRYYDPANHRFINADDTTYLNADGTFLSCNLFAYCKNNPLMYIDPSGNAPEWWKWVVSGAMVVTGVALVATGVGGAAGGALLCAGTNSIIGSYTSEATGGSSTSGWVGGMITGAVCGMGAGLAGGYLMEATKTAGVVCLKNIAKSGAIAFGSGFAGSALGQVTSAGIDGKKLNAQDVVISSVYAGSVNLIAGLFAGMGSSLQEMPEFTTTTTALANSVNAAFSVFAETVCDLLSIVPNLLP